MYGIGVLVICWYGPSFAVLRRIWKPFTGLAAYHVRMTLSPSRRFWSAKSPDFASSKIPPLLKRGVGGLYAASRLATATSFPSASMIRKRMDVGDAGMLPATSSLLSPSPSFSSPLWGG